MTNAEAERALIAQVPVVHQGIRYKMIAAIILRKTGVPGQREASAELTCFCGHSLTIARLDRVNWQNPEDGTRDIPVPPQNEDGPAPQEILARRAFWSGQEVLYEGERCVVSALKVRRWIDYPYWLEVVLTRLSDRAVIEAWSGSVCYTTKNKRRD